MKEISFIFFLLFFMGSGCSLRYTLIEDENVFSQINQISKIRYKCEERNNAGKYITSNFCPSEKLVSASKSDKYIDINIKRTLYSTDISPAMPLFLGLIPSKSTYEYSINAKVIDGGDTISEQKSTLYIVETWGSVNTIKKIFGVSNNLESLESKLFAHLEEQLIMSNNMLLHNDLSEERN